MPWCPKCREEYREGFKACIDCGAELVDELPPLAENDDAGEMDRSAEAGEYKRIRRAKRRPVPAGDGVWCPRCGTEYRREFTLCSDCGAELVDDPAEIEEEDEAGEDDDGMKPFCDAHLTTVAAWPEAEMMESCLNEDGIPVMKVAGGSGVDIYVPEELLEAARDVIGRR